MKKKLTSLGVFLCLILLHSCTSNSLEDLTETIDLENVTYSNRVKGIIDNNCISCHSSTPVNGASMPLVTYEQVRDAVENGDVLERISLTPGEPSFMPLGNGRLPQQAINAIQAWAAQGFNE